MSTCLITMSQSHRHMYSEHHLLDPVPLLPLLPPSLFSLPSPLWGGSALGGNRPFPSIGCEGECVVEAIEEAIVHSSECVSQLLQSINTAASRSLVIKVLEETAHIVCLQSEGVRGGEGVWVIIGRGQPLARIHIQMHTHTPVYCAQMWMQTSGTYTHFVLRLLA